MGDVENISHSEENQKKTELKNRISVLFRVGFDSVWPSEPLLATECCYVFLIYVYSPRTHQKTQ